MTLTDIFISIEVNKLCTVIKHVGTTYTSTVVNRTQASIVQWLACWNVMREIEVQFPPVIQFFIFMGECFFYFFSLTIYKWVVIRGGGGGVGILFLHQLYTLSTGKRCIHIQSSPTHTDTHTETLQTCTHTYTHT